MMERINHLITDKSISKGIIITDHNYENIIKISTKLALMKEGKMFHLKNKNELVERGYLREGMI